MKKILALFLGFCWVTACSQSDNLIGRLGTDAKCSRIVSHVEDSNVKQYLLDFVEKYEYEFREADFKNKLRYSTGSPGHLEVTDSLPWLELGLDPSAEIRLVAPIGSEGRILVDEATALYVGEKFSYGYLVKFKNSSSFGFPREDELIQITDRIKLLCTLHK